MISIAGIRAPLSYDENWLRGKSAERLSIDAACIRQISISSRAVDLSDKNDICYLISICVLISENENEVVWRIKDKKITIKAENPYTVPVKNGREQNCSGQSLLEQRPIVVGCGPAGMFAALILAQAGACPILLERGMEINDRKQSVAKFWATGDLDIHSNVQFGAGGAGTFSDGKLKIGMKDQRKIKILNELVEAGAPEEILYESKPHIGTDNLHGAVQNIVNKITSLGGEVLFQAAVIKIIQRDGQVTGVGYRKDDTYTELSASHVVLAIGHSARDTFSYLDSIGIKMEQKPFAVGVRIEHPQSLINKIKFGTFAEDPRLGAADYKMVVHLPNQRNVYTFCMCPGGSVVAATSEERGLVTNGMSTWRRDGRNANSALLVTVNPEDLKSDHPLAGILYQREIEAAAFKAGGENHHAPVQRLGDFLEGRETKAFGEVLPTYRPGTEFASIESYLPEEIWQSLRQGLIEMGQWMPGYAYPDALLTGAETRSTSPVRILRGGTLEAEGIKGLYPCGEGAGYAGGIISAAVDGIRCAEKIIEE